MITATHPTFIAFYADAALAARVAPALMREDRGEHVQVQTRGAETIVWSGAPTSDRRNMVWSCLPR
ncbi:MAG TPA: hypothetical protein VMF57_13285 [Solirubrobacteraceae bacterium]|nr:hypothetical protein [Solirubrobacteraceae bacterium]